MSEGNKDDDPELAPHPQTLRGSARMGRRKRIPRRRRTSRRPTAGGTEDPLRRLTTERIGNPPRGLSLDRSPDRNLGRSLDLSLDPNLDVNLSRSLGLNLDLSLRTRGAEDPRGRAQEIAPLTTTGSVKTIERTEDPRNRASRGRRNLARKGL